MIILVVIEEFKFEVGLFKNIVLGFDVYSADATVNRLSFLSFIL